jgi:ankyrin repeat protein
VGRTAPPLGPAEPPAVPLTRSPGFSAAFWAWQVTKSGTALHFAALTGQADCTAALLELGEDVNARVGVPHECRGHRVSCPGHEFQEAVGLGRGSRALYLAMSAGAAP